MTALFGRNGRRPCSLNRLLVASFTSARSLTGRGKSLRWSCQMTPRPLVVAALLHDIGYAPELATTGYHTLDGARFIGAHGEPNVASLVAHHTDARREASAPWS